MSTLKTNWLWLLGEFLNSPYSSTQMAFAPSMPSDGVVNSREYSVGYICYTMCLCAIMQGGRLHLSSLHYRDWIGNQLTHIYHVCIWSALIRMKRQSLPTRWDFQLLVWFAIDVSMLLTNNKVWVATVLVGSGLFSWWCCISSGRCFG